MKTLASLLFLLASGSAAAQSIGVNFASINTPTSLLNPGDVAGAPGFAQSGFNNVTAVATGLSLADSTGAMTTATLTTTGANSFGIFTANFSTAQPDEVFNNGRANFASSTGTTWSFTLSNIPYASYSLVVYNLQFAVGGVTSLNAGGTTYFASSPQYNGAGYIDNNPATPFTYTQATSTDSLAPTPQSNYVVFANQTGSSITVTIVGAANATRINGFQIVPIPEASTWALLLAGGSGLLLTARRRRVA